MRMPGNEATDEETKTTQEDSSAEIPTTRHNQLDKNESFENKKKMAKKWERNENRKKEVEWSKDTKGMNRRDQIVITILKAGYTRPTHSHVVKRQENIECRSCNFKLTHAKKQKKRDEEWR
jgi:hypothetical protein